jgi:hypothetical protein
MTVVLNRNGYRMKWHAYSANDPNEESPVSHGNYAAQWIHLYGEWKIQSKLFVTLN